MQNNETAPGAAVTVVAAGLVRYVGPEAQMPNCVIAEAEDILAVMFGGVSTPHPLALGAADARTLAVESVVESSDR